MGHGSGKDWHSTHMDCFSAASTSNAYDPDKPIMTALGFLGKLPGGKFPLPPFYVVKEPKRENYCQPWLSHKAHNADKTWKRNTLDNWSLVHPTTWHRRYDVEFVTFSSPGFNLTSLNLGLTRTKQIWAIWKRHDAAPPIYNYWHTSVWLISIISFLIYYIHQRQEKRQILPQQHITHQLEVEWQTNLSVGDKSLK